MRILGIDPGLQCTGFGVVDAEGAALHYVASGTIQTSPKDGALLPARLKILFDGISEVVQRYQPECLPRARAELISQSIAGTLDKTVRSVSSPEL